MDANHVTEPHAEDVILAGRWRSNALLLPDQIHGVNEHGKATLRKQLKRDQMASFFATLAPCLRGMEACGSAHHWARKLQGFGHTVRLMAPQFVKPYVKTNKNLWSSPFLQR